MKRADFIEKCLSLSDNSPVSSIGKPLGGTFYCAMGYLNKENQYKGYKSGSIKYRQPNKRKDTEMALTPIPYENKAKLVEKLNEMIKFIEESDIG